MIHIAFFGHDAGDAAIKRRALGFRAVGYEVSGFMMRRHENQRRAWNNIDLGQTFDAAYAQRLSAVFRGAKRAVEHAELLRKVDLIYARNLDMLICAMMVKRKLGLTIPVIYECLDVHHLLTGNSPIAVFLRYAERKLIERTKLLVFSSPAFEREFFAKYYAGRYRPYLLENRLIEDEKLPARVARTKRQALPLRIGWFGILRCSRSLRLLEKLAVEYGAQIEIVTHGLPAETQVPDFYDVIARHDNMSYGGPYKAPEDLERIYASVDLIWAGDFYQAGFNSKWLLPNRIYEGGYFCTPAIAPAETETGKWVREHGVGFTVDEPLEETLVKEVLGIIDGRDKITSYADNLLQKDEMIFVQPISQLKHLIETALTDGDSSRP